MNNSAFTQQSLGKNSTIVDETPGGTINGSNAAFTTANNYVTGTLAVYRDGIRLQQGATEDFTEDGANDFTMATAPETGSILLVDYTQSVTNRGNADTLDGYNATDIWQLIYPVGAIYTSIVATSPETLFGGTWAIFGAGKMLISLDSGDVDFDAAEETGGAKTATIAQANLPNISTGAGTSHNHTQNAHSHSGITTSMKASGTNYTGFRAVGYGASNGSVTGPSVASNTATNQAEAAHTHSLGGSGTAMSTMNPYITVHMWKRTA